MGSISPALLVQGEQLRATITGAEAKALNVQLIDLNGKPIRSQQWQQAEAKHAVKWNLAGQASGVLQLPISGKALN